MSISRLQKECKDMMMDPPAGITAKIKDNNLSKWCATISGPTGTPYEGGIFELDVDFPIEYPFRPPKIKFKTNIYHCNINDDTGEICLDLLKDNWSPAFTLSKTLLSISSLIADCNPNDPLVPLIANLYKTNRKEHDKNAREFTAKHAIKNNITKQK